MTGTDLTQIKGAGASVVAAPAEPSISALVQYALQSNAGAEQLERVVNLLREEKDRQARAAFFEALAAFQDECPDIPKDSTARITHKNGGAHSYTYAKFETITRVIAPILHKHGLSYSFDTELAAGNLLNVVCILRHIQGHQERAGFPVPSDTKAEMSEAQKIGAALTYGRRQSLISVLGLTTADSDNDAGKPEDASPITLKQAADLKDLIEEVFGADAAPRRTAQLLKFFKAPAIEDIRACDYSAAVKQIESMRAA